MQLADLAVDALEDPHGAIVEVGPADAPEAAYQAIKVAAEAGHGAPVLAGPPVQESGVRTRARRIDPLADLELRRFAHDMGLGVDVLHGHDMRWRIALIERRDTQGDGARFKIAPFLGGLGDLEHEGPRVVGQGADFTGIVHVLSLALATFTTHVRAPQFEGECPSGCHIERFCQDKREVRRRVRRLAEPDVTAVARGNGGIVIPGAQTMV